MLILELKQVIYYLEKEMDKNFIFKFGKHVGKTYAWVEENHPSYIVWAKENAPNLLKTPKSKAEPKPEVKKEITLIDDKPSSMVPNTNFYNEGPDPISIPYLKKMEEEKNKKNDLDLDLLF